MENALRVTLGVRENERTALLAARLPKKIKSELESAKKHPDGCPFALAGYIVDIEGLVLRHVVPEREDGRRQAEAPVC